MRLGQILLAVASIMTAFASRSVAQDQMTLQKRCTRFADLAEAIMSGRQNGGIMSDAMAPAQDDTAMDHIARVMILAAYSQLQALAP